MLSMEMMIRSPGARVKSSFGTIPVLVIRNGSSGKLSRQTGSSRVRSPGASVPPARLDRHSQEHHRVHLNANRCLGWEWSRLSSVALVTVCTLVLSRRSRSKTLSRLSIPSMRSSIRVLWVRFIRSGERVWPSRAKRAGFA